MFSKRGVGILAGQIAVIVVILILWEELVDYRILSPLLMAPPSKVFPVFWQTMVSPDVASAMALMLELIALATIISVAIGTFFGLIVGSITYLRNVLEEYIVAFYALPKAIFLPFFWLLFGISVLYNLAYAVIAGTLPILLTMMYAAETVDPTLLRMARTAGASSRQRYFKVFLPSVVPSLMAGIRLAVSGAFIGVIFSEMYSGNTGAGYLVRWDAQFFELTEMYSIVLAVIIIAVVANISLLLLERRMTRWKSTASI